MLINYMLVAGCRCFDFQDDFLISDGHNAHDTEAFEGDRHSIVYYSCNSHHGADAKDRHAMRNRIQLASEEQPSTIPTDNSANSNNLKFHKLGTCVGIHDQF